MNTFNVPKIFNTEYENNFSIYLNDIEADLIVIENKGDFIFSNELNCYYDN